MNILQEFRRSQEPEDRSTLDESYYNLLEEYNSPLLRSELPGTFEHIDVRETESRYPGLRITYNYSTIFLAPQSHCDPIKYMYNDSLAAKTLDAHLWINGYQEDLGCDKGLQKFDKGVRYVFAGCVAMTETVTVTVTVSMKLSDCYMIMVHFCYCVVLIKMSTGAVFVLHCIVLYCTT